MLPMGTIMAVCMLIAAIFSSQLLGLNKQPKGMRYSIAGLVFLAGCWNVFWYALQHLTEFWGIAALVSGCLMLICAGYIYNAKILPLFLQSIRLLIQFLVLLCSVLYGVTIYNL